MRIAIIGDRGIPAKYSGFSTLAEEMAVRLVRDHGMDVTVYCRRQYFEQRPATYRGVRLEYLAAPGGKSFESIVHSNFAVLHAAVLRKFDLVFIVDPGNGPFALPLLARGVPVVFHTDGLGWKRTKWSKLQRRYYKWSEWVCAKIGSWLITDSRAMQDYYRSEYGANSTFIPYGNRAGETECAACLGKYGLRRGEYYLVVARMEPENNTDLAIREYKASGATKPLVIVGGARYESDYYKSIAAQADDRVRILGPVYDSAALNALYRDCYLYIHAHEVGGTNPSLLRAMGAAAPSLPLGVVYHRECMGEEAEYFEKTPGNLASILTRLDSDPARVRELGEIALQRASTWYRWDAVADAYATLFKQMIQARRARRRFGAATDQLETYRPLSFQGPEWDPPTAMPTSTNIDLPTLPATVELPTLTNLHLPVPQAKQSRAPVTASS